MQYKKIMVVEDEIIIGMDLRNTLQKLGYQVPAVIASGEKAIEKVAEIKPDLILMDIILRGKIDGITAAAEICSNFQIPIVYLTAHTDLSTLERAKQTEPFGYVVKPFEERELHTTIEIALARFKAETEVRKALLKEKELNELKSRFVSMISHEFRNPLASILVSAELLEIYGHKCSEEAKINHLHRIQAGVKKLTSLLEDVLLLGKEEAGKLEFKPVPINLEKFCLDLIEEIRMTDREQHQIEFYCSEIPEAYMDEQLLHHILVNLLSNAVKYSPAQSKIIVRVSCANNEQELIGHREDKQNVSFNFPIVIFQIQDEGIGIPVDDQKYLFEAFHRATNVENISGTGLGLTITKRSVDLHGGQINVDSKVGIGTTFTVNLPLKN